MLSPVRGRLARAALALAAEDPATATAIEPSANALPPTATPIAETIALISTVTAALAILQTELTLERTAAGKWKAKLHKRPASDSLLKALAQLLMRALNLGAGDGKAPPRLPK